MNGENNKREEGEKWLLFSRKLLESIKTPIQNFTSEAIHAYYATDYK